MFLVSLPFSVLVVAFSLWILLIQGSSKKLVLTTLDNRRQCFIWFSMFLCCFTQLCFSLRSRCERIVCMRYHWGSTRESLCNTRGVYSNQLSWPARAIRQIASAASSPKIDRTEMPGISLLVQGKLSVVSIIAWVWQRSSDFPCVCINVIVMSGRNAANSLFFFFLLIISFYLQWPFILIFSYSFAW